MVSGQRRAARRRNGEKAEKPIALYYWPTPNGWKIAIMLEECKLPYEVRYVDITRGEQFDPAFLKISPNNRMPAIVDPDGPGGKAISIFESGAILQYLGNKTGKFYPRRPRERVEVEQWLYWQVGNLGPMAGQAHHFRLYLAGDQPYSVARYTNEVSRLYGVMDERLKDREFVAGRYSIADMACVGWIRPYRRQGQDIDEFPHLKRWLETVMARPAVERAMALGKERRRRIEDVVKDADAVRFLFGQRARDSSQG
ncbi:MAG TPA: glutathione S-transferase N-terminal domain-containing protein [Hyphomicrobiales bacterium]|nr:glutathione S-transferase N-terminal domain-containing protein [Hyphomicrobiales bacterium]